MANESSAPAAAPRNGRGLISASSLVTVLIDMMGVGLILPVLPSLVGEFTQPRIAVVLVRGHDVHLRLHAVPVRAALGRSFRPLWTADGAPAFGRGPGHDVPAIGTRAVAALWSGRESSAVCLRRTSRWPTPTLPTSPRRTIRARSFGLVGAAFGFGFILGPMIGGLVGGIGVRIPFFIAAGLSLINFAYGLFVLPESLPASRRRPINLKKANPFAALVGLARLRGVGMLVTVIALSAWRSSS